MWPHGPARDRSEGYTDGYTTTERKNAMQHTARRSFGDNGVPANGNETTTRTAEENTMSTTSETIAEVLRSGEGISYFELDRIRAWAVDAHAALKAAGAELEQATVSGAEAHPRFWVLSGGALNQGGRKVSGPYSTTEDAFTARSSLEKLVSETFWVDSEDTTP